MENKQRDPTGLQIAGICAMIVATLVAVWVFLPP